jgi:hypothetical protein
MTHTERVWYALNVWKQSIWYSLTRSTLFDDVIRNFESYSGIQTVSEPGTCEPGMDVICSPFLELLKRIEMEE